MISFTLWAETALLAGGWADRVRISVSGGRIARIDTGVEPKPADQRRACLLPAPVNLHSHTFQRAMAGMTEARGGSGQDSFWTWRQLMYRFLDHLTPEDVHCIAAFAQMEMLEAGFAGVAEFHYLHHQCGGVPYADLAELSARIVAAAAETGIGLTLLPVIYEQGGCDGRALTAGQLRFGNDGARFFRLWEKARKAVASLGPDAVCGIAPHSLRAVRPDTLAMAGSHASGLPLHMHLAEQQAEVDDVLAHLGARPVEWLLANAGVSERWCLIHATRMLPHETLALAATGAVAGLCPITEANLGDGIFDGVRWQAARGRWGVGSDSNVRISLIEELRTLEYSQRLRDRGRAMLAREGQSTGRVLIASAAEGGAQAAGRGAGHIAPGLWADLLALDLGGVDLEGRAGDAILDAWIFADGTGAVADVWSAGRHVVQGGRHLAREAVTHRYRAVMAGLRGRL